MLKRIIHTTFFIVSILTILTIAIFGFSQVVAFFNTGADRAEMLLLSGKQVHSNYQPKATWVPNDLVEGRKLEKGTKIKLLADYLNSYYFLYNTSSNWFSKGLKDYFTKKSRTHLGKLINYAESTQQHLQGTTISHLIKPKFYAADGTAIVLTDQVVSYNEVVTNSKMLSYYDTSTYEVMLLLEDNFWRIRHKVKTTEQIGPKVLTHPKKSEIEISKGKFYENGKHFDLKCINYYPQKNPWQEMWKHFDEKEIKKDLLKVKSLGFNSIRIFVPYDEFNKEELKTKRLAQLNQLLTITDQLDIKVIVTLFDFFLGYHLLDWTLSDRHLEQVVQSVQNHPSLFAWDVKNEPDLDFDSQGEEQVKKWLKFIIQRLKTYDPVHFVTIGWSQPEISSSLTELVDFISYHFYRNPSELGDYLAKKEKSDLPVFIGEIGMHSFNSWWFPFGKSQEEQAQHVSDVLSLIKANELHYGLWTLYDFKRIPSNVAGSVPWKKNPQKKYGIIDTKNRKKKVYSIILNFNCDEK